MSFFVLIRHRTDHPIWNTNARLGASLSNRTYRGLFVVNRFGAAVLKFDWSLLAAVWRCHS
jgi:hypothetical protein